MTTEAGTGTPAAGTGTPAAGTGTPAAGTGTPAAPWHGIADPTEAAYVDNKGWKSPADVIKSYKGAEKLVGRDPSSLLTLPKQGDAAGWDAFYSQIGRPASPDKYDLKIGADGMEVDPGFQTAIAAAFHKAGLTGEQAKLVAGEYTGLLKAQMTQQAKDYELNVTTDKNNLLREWGGGYERMMNAAQTAVASLGFDTNVVSAIEGAIGYGATMKLFADLGQKFADPKFVSGEGQPKIPGQMTPQEANAEIEKLKQDTAFQATLRDKQNPSYKSNYAKWQSLFAIAFPG